MKNWSQKLFLTGLLLFVLGGTAGAQSRIATVDLRKLFDGYWKTKQADAALKERAADLDKEDKNLREDFKKATEEYQKLLSAAGDQAVSAEEREKRKKAAEAKLKDLKDTEDTIQQFERQARTTLDEQKRRMRDNILGEIRTTINAKAKSGGFALVVDMSAETANATPVFVYSSGDTDITEGVLTQLNLGAPLETAKPAEKKEEKAEKK